MASVRIAAMHCERKKTSQENPAQSKTGERRCHLEFFICTCAERFGHLSGTLSAPPVREGLVIGLAVVRPSVIFHQKGGKHGRKLGTFKLGFLYAGPTQ